jgi:hypothetical protein
MVLIALRGRYRYGSKMTMFTVSHDPHDHQTVRGARDLPGNGITVQQEIQQLIDGRVHSSP